MIVIDILNHFMLCFSSKYKNNFLVKRMSFIFFQFLVDFYVKRLNKFKQFPSVRCCLVCIVFKIFLTVIRNTIFPSYD